MAMKREEKRRILMKNLYKAHAKLRMQREEKHIILSSNTNADFAYSLGAVLGDGFISFPKSGGGFIGLSVKDKDFALEFKNCFDRWIEEESRLFFYNDFWKVHKVSTVAAKIMKNFDLENFINAQDEIKCAFLKGLFDAEGTISMKYKRIRFYNTDKELLDIIVRLLESIEIESRILNSKHSKGHMGKKEVFVIHISRRNNIMKYRDKVGFSIKRKHQLLEKAIESYKCFMQDGAKKT